jgi:hypothetical protein
MAFFSCTAKALGGAAAAAAGVGLTAAFSGDLLLSGPRVAFSHCQVSVRRCCASAPLAY